MGDWTRRRWIASAPRVTAPEIAAMRPAATSLMPGGLLKGLQPADLADLCVCLRPLGK